MTPDELGNLIDRLLDDALAPDERDALAARLSDDPLLRQQLSDELALALQIRASLADDAEQRADLLMATLSGSRRLALERRINQQLDEAADRRPWLPWASVAAAALLVAMIGGWWLTHDRSRGPLVAAPSQLQPRPAPVAAQDVRDSSPTAANDTAPAPDGSPAPAADAVATRPIPDAVVPPAPAPAPTTTDTAIGSKPGPAPGDDALAATIPPAPTTNPSPTPVVADHAVVANPQLPINATQAKPGTPLPVSRSQRLIPPLLINGSARLRRLGRESAIDANVRLVPGDEILVDGEGAELTNDRGVTWWSGPGTRLILPMPKPTDVARQPIHLTTGTLHVTAGQNLRPLITTPHIRIDVEDADLWISVTSAWTRVETVSGSVRLGTQTVRPLAAGSYAVVLPGLPPAINPSSQTRLAVIAGRFARNGEAVIPRIVRGVPVAVAAEAGASGVLAPLGDAVWLDQAAAHDLLALAEVPTAMPSQRILRNAALTAWVADGDLRGAPGLRRVDALRPIHLSGPPPVRMPGWATSAELAGDADAGSGRAMLAVVPVDDQVRAGTWDALVRGANGVIWSVSNHQDPGASLRPLAAAVDATSSLLTDGVRTRLSLSAASGSEVTAARWDRLDRRLIVVVNRSREVRPVVLSQTRGLQPLEADDSIVMTQSGDSTSAQLPPGAVLVLLGNHS